jgi:hypothetical protein
LGDNMNDEQSIFSPPPKQDYQGPFSKWTSIEAKEQRPIPPPPAYPGKGAAVAYGIEKFVEGIRKGRIEKFARQEAKKNQEAQTFRSFVNSVSNRDDLSEAAKNDIAKTFYQTWGAAAKSEMDTASKGSKKSKGQSDNPNDPQNKFGVIHKIAGDVVEGLTGGKAPPKGGPDFSEVQAQIQAKYFDERGNVKPEYSKTKSLSEITQKFGGAMEAATTPQAQAKVTAEFFPNFAQILGGDVKTALGTMGAMTPALPTPQEQLFQRGMQLKTQPAAQPPSAIPTPPPGPVAQAGSPSQRGPSAPPAPANNFPAPPPSSPVAQPSNTVAGPPSTGQPAPTASLISGSAPPVEQSAYDKMAIDYVNKLTEGTPKAKADKEATLKGGGKIPVIENSEESDPAKRWIGLDGKPIDPTTIQGVDEKAPHQESATQETQDTMYGAYAEEHNIDPKKLTALQKRTAMAEWKKASAEASQMSMDPGAMDLAANLTLMNPRFLSLLGGGMGGAALRVKVLDRANRLKDKFGMTAEDVAANGMGFAANQSSLVRLQPQADMTDMLSNFVDKQLDRLDARAKEIGLSDNRYANKTMNWFKQNMAGDKKISAYLQLVNATQNEIGSILANRAMSSTLPVAVVNDMKQFLSGDATYPQMQEMIKLLKIEKKNKQQALQGQIQAIKERVLNSIPEPDSIVTNQDDPAGLSSFLGKGK